jgi:hypothetical protein
MFTRTFAVLLAFVAAIPTFVFLSYAPFVSHDIAPGLLFLGLLLGADAYCSHPRRSLWWALVGIGAAAALIKHSYALFWVIAWIVQAVFAATAGKLPAAGTGVRSRKHPVEKSRRASRRKAGSFAPDWKESRLLALLGAAAASAGITILVLGWTLGDTYSDSFFLARAFRQAKFLAFNAGVQTIEQPVWVYLRNLPAYGLLPIVLLPLGAVKSWRESRRQRGLVIAWVLAVGAVHLMSLHQVRYMLFVAPITMCLLVPGARLVLANRRMTVGALALLLCGFLPIHPYSIAREASRIGTEFYRRSEAKWFLEPIREEGVYRSPIYLDWGLLSFLPPGSSALAGDIYHKLFHLAPHHLIDLFPYDPDEVGHLDIPRLTAMPIWGEETVYIHAARPPQFNPVTWRRGPASDKFEQEQLLFLARILRMRPAMIADSTGATRPGWIVEESSGTGILDRENTVEIAIASTERGEPFSVMRSSAFPDRVPALMPMRVQILSEGSVYPMREIGTGQWAVPVVIPPMPPMDGVGSASPGKADADERGDPESAGADVGSASSEGVILLHFFEEVRRHRNEK